MAFSSVVVFLPDGTLQLFDQSGDITAADLLRRVAAPPNHEVETRAAARSIRIPAHKVLEKGGTYHIVPAGDVVTAGGGASGAGTGGGVGGSGGDSGGSNRSAAGYVSGAAAADVLGEVADGAAGRAAATDSSDPQRPSGRNSGSRGGGSVGDGYRRLMAELEEAEEEDREREGGSNLASPAGTGRRAEDEEGDRYLDLGPPVLRGIKALQRELARKDSGIEVVELPNRLSHSQELPGAAGGGEGGGVGKDRQRKQQLAIRLEDMTGTMTAAMLAAACKAGPEKLDG